MDRRFAEALEVASLARLAHLSPNHYIREFRRTFGETPHQYLYRRRIERAAVLLRSTDRSVTEIAVEVGYASLGTFSRTFVRLLGRTPTVHRALGPLPPAPGCWLMAAGRPVRPPDQVGDFGEAGEASAS
ncbi:hypothetical protein CGZ93_09950 [Enemella dayhoffiae]|uniref:HTH araC/xylS-type domain-containing protein n=2 Tax=Enemella dayhoffiae TaxID=2016507 RepID=A0A255H1V5_9ACTN|nr:hypothetical protein CGZ93_09950 [Enemella dayhoffiae]